MKRILVGLSWGVDSAVAAYLLKEQGHEVVWGFMKNYLDEENPNCTTRIDSQEAIKVAKFLGIELLSFDFIKEYEERIIQYIYSSYEQGITPNPDILCNSLVKFDLFLEKALEQGFDAVATGHYARIKYYPPKSPLYFSPKGRNSPIFLPLQGGSKWEFLPLGGRLGGGSSKIPLNEKTEANVPSPRGRAREGKISLTKEIVKDRWLVRDWIHFPVNPQSKEKAKILRKNQTPAEKKLRDELLKNFSLKVKRQFPIDHYIVDFFCSKLNLVIEVDWWYHTTKDQKEHDKMRTDLLKIYWLKVIRFSNEEIFNNFEWVSRKINEEIRNCFDYNKDQSYFLSGLNQYQLSKAVFPLGGLTKPEVRAIAEKIGLPNANRKDSQGLCFIWNIKIRNFLAERLAKKEGNIVLTDWTVVGKHQGAYFFTIGQSRGLDINKKAYVCKIDVKNNELVVSYDKNDPLLLQQTIQLRNWHWISDPSAPTKSEQLPSKGSLEKGSWDLPFEEGVNSSPLGGGTPECNEGGGSKTGWMDEWQIPCTAKIRYRHVPEPATLQWNHWKHWEKGSMEITFDTPQWGIAPGQSIVAYDGDVCLGGGVII